MRDRHVSASMQNQPHARSWHQHWKISRVPVSLRCLTTTTVHDWMASNVQKPVIFVDSRPQLVGLHTRYLAYLKLEEFESMLHVNHGKVSQSASLCSFVHLIYLQPTLRKFLFPSVPPNVSLGRQAGVFHPWTNQQ